VAVGILLTTSHLNAHLSNPPVGHTGAPGENSCATAGCHNTIVSDPVSTWNPEAGFFWWIVDNHFLPNDTVDVRIDYSRSINWVPFTKLGFEVTVTDSDGAAVGKFLLDDPVRTGLFESPTGRSYVFHTPAGAVPGNEYGTRWTLRWIAPEHFVDHVTFHVVGVGADGDGTPAGDWVARSTETIYDPTVCRVPLTGDVNLDGSITSADVIAGVWYLFKGVWPPACPATGDVNCSGAVTSADIIAMVGFIFKGGPPFCDVCTLIPDTWTCP
jgi:hypothetical protein